MLTKNRQNDYRVHEKAPLLFTVPEDLPQYVRRLIEDETHAVHNELSKLRSHLEFINSETSFLKERKAAMEEQLHLIDELLNKVFLTSGAPIMEKIKRLVAWAEKMDTQNKS